MAERDLDITNPVFLRRQEMYDVITSQKRGTKQTLAQLAKQLRRKKNEAFSRDLAFVRQWAYDDGHYITHCTYDSDDKEHVFFFLRQGEEDGLSERPLRMASAHALTRVRTLGRAGAYVAKNAESPETRLYGTLNQNWSDFSRSAMDAIDSYWEHKERSM